MNDTTFELSIATWCKDNYPNFHNTTLSTIKTVLSRIYTKLEIKNEYNQFDKKNNINGTYKYYGNDIMLFTDLGFKKYTKINDQTYFFSSEYNEIFFEFTINNKTLLFNKKNEK